MKECKVAFVIPSMLKGPYWQPIFTYLTQLFSHFTVYTSVWNGYIANYTGMFNIEVVEGIRFLKRENKVGFYEHGIVLLPVSLLKKLIKYKPQIIITSTFGIWTILAIIYKFFFRVKVILLYEGSSPSVDFRGSVVRTMLRKTLTFFIDGYLTNTIAGKKYLTEHLKISGSKISQFPIETPDLEFFENAGFRHTPKDSKIKYIVSSQIITRKGIDKLIIAVNEMKKKGITDFVVKIAGSGEKLEEYKKLVVSLELDTFVIFLGQLSYEDLKTELIESDVYILPSLEDTWGVAPLEALATGKPTLVSCYVGSSELIENYKNGLVFNPYDSIDFSEKMTWFIENKSALMDMSKNALETIMKYNAKTSSHLIKESVLKFCKTW